MTRFAIKAGFLSLFLIGFGLNLTHAQFEGVVTFEKIKAETTKYQYHIKGNKVRIDEFGHDGNVKGVMLVDTEKNTVIALNPERKLYMNASNAREAAPVVPKVTKTKNTKELMGYNCTEWIARNDAENTEIHYWVADAKFEFFVPLLKTLNRKDKLSRYYLAIDGVADTFTMIGEERSLAGNPITKLQVTKVEKSKLEDSLFDIPSDYVEFQK